ncbi:MAG: transposase, partial [Kiritimatiellia bacterium]
EGERKGRGLRILPKGLGYFVHVTSRTRGQEFLLGDQEKRSFLLRMRQWSEFSGIGVLTHCLMSNHFHMLLWVPEISSVSHEEIVSRLRGVWPEEKVEAWLETYAGVSAEKQKAMDQVLIDRMGNLPAFMRVLKQSFSNWYNHRNDCRGTFWEGRYRSVVVEHNPLALMSVAAYIDLNPVRAAMVSDPMDYIWSGYGSACGGNQASQKGLEFLQKACRDISPSAYLFYKKSHQTDTGPSKDSSDWRSVVKSYRIWLYSKGEETTQTAGPLSKKPLRKGIDPAKVYLEYLRNGNVPEARFLLQRWRCFSRGVGIGSPAFLEGLFRQYRTCFGPKRLKAGNACRISVPGLETLRKVD